MRQGHYRKNTYVRFDNMNEAFPGKAGFTDVDAVIERNGYFLFLEWKSADEQLPRGQQILLERLSEQPRTNVILVNGDRQGNEVQWIQQVRKGKWQKPESVSMNDLIVRLNKWYQLADERRELAI